MRDCFLLTPHVRQHASEIFAFETAKTSGYSNGFSQISKDQLRWPHWLDRNGRKSDRISGNRDPWRKKYIYRRKKQSGLLMNGLLKYNHEGCQQMLRCTWSCKLLKFFYRK